MGRGPRFFTPNKPDATFWNLNHCVKFHKNLIKIAVVGAMTDTLTDRQTQVIL